LTIEPAAATPEPAPATSEPATATSPYLSLRRAVRPAILAHQLLAGDQERAGTLAAECEDLLYLTRELLKAAGRARILAVVPGPRMADESGGDRQAQLLEAYADAGLLWTKVVWEAHREQLRAISNNMPPASIELAINTLRAILREVPEEFPDRNREVNSFLPPLASAVHAIMKKQGAEIPYHSRMEHIATGGVAKYPDIVKTSLDELAAEFDGICRRPGEPTT
jgi:hypothetical protein